MAKRGKPEKAPAPPPVRSTVVSIRLTPEEAEAFRVEAARRGLRRNGLFYEMWRTYQESRRDDPK